MNNSRGFLGGGGGVNSRGFSGGGGGVRGGGGDRWDIIGKKYKVIIFIFIYLVWWLVCLL